MGFLIHKMKHFKYRINNIILIIIYGKILIILMSFLYFYLVNKIAKDKYLINFIIFLIFLYMIMHIRILYHNCVIIGVSAIVSE